MIALGILTTWLTLTAAGFAGLSALRRAGVREDADAGLMPAGRKAPAFSDARVPIPKALLR
ncbi:MAG TPA: hypothetical protein VG053_06060 [Solirubrobacteraceae bacterium]|jgi:hypothetical protein|nr:hypothetical protein [Solirubrobacteraceae bacterium]